MQTGFPNRVWDGQSGTRENNVTDRPPDNLDWNRIIAELAATQAYLLALNEIVQNLSGGGTPGGSNGQIQINSSDSFAALRGNVLVNDLNGLTDAVAIGNGSFALGEQSFVLGHNCIASTDQSIALGYQCQAGDPPRACTISGTTITISGGDYTFWFYDTDDGGLVLSKLSGDSGPIIAYGSIADGGVIYDSGSNSTILTLKASVTSHTSGFANMRDDYTQSVSMGNNCVAVGGVALGNNAVATGYLSSSTGSATTASGNRSHAEGDSTTASGVASHAEGSTSIASGDWTHAEGYLTTASGNYSHAEGNNTTASGLASYAGGINAVANLKCEWSRSDNNLGKIGHLIVSGTCSDTNPINLLISSSDVLAITSNKNVTFFIILSGTTSDGATTASFIRYGQIKNISGTLTLSSVQTIGTDINANSWSVSITADSGNSALQISVTAVAGVNWQGRIEFVEVGF